MTPQFRLTEPAIRDIEQIADYIAHESGLAQADRFLTRLDAKFSKLITPALPKLIALIHPVMPVRDRLLCLVKIINTQVT